VTSVSSFAKAAEDAGPTAVSLVNTFLAMVTRRRDAPPEDLERHGGLSGPANPADVAVRMVYECARKVRIPVIGMGGIASASGRRGVHDRRRDSVQVARRTSWTRSSGRNC